MLPTVTEYISAYTPFFVWTDIIDLFFCIGIVYGLSRWFAHDTSKPLLAYFYAYLVAIFSACWLPLPLIYTILSAGWPCALVIGIILHQKILQKNFVGLNFYAAHRVIQHDWIKELVRFSTQWASTGKKITWIIQKNHDIRPVCTQHIPINAPITFNLLSILIEGHTVNFEYPFLVDTTGTLLSANIQISETQPNKPAPASKHLLELTHINNSIACSTNVSGAFDLFSQGSIVQNVPAQALISYIKKYCLSTEQPLAKELYENTVSLQEKRS